MSRILRVRPRQDNVEIQVVTAEGDIVSVEMTREESRRWALKILLAGHGEEIT